MEQVARALEAPASELTVIHKGKKLKDGDSLLPPDVDCGKGKEEERRNGGKGKGKGQSVTPTFFAL